MHCVLSERKHLNFDEWQIRASNSLLQPIIKTAVDNKMMGWIIIVLIFEMILSGSVTVFCLK